MTDHPQWLVVAECPGGAGRDFGISVLHRKCTDPDAAWTEDAEELEQNARCDRGEGEKYSRVAGGDDWRSLMITLLATWRSMSPFRCGQTTYLSWAAQRVGPITP